ncbi:cyclin-like protein [Cryomyces antarcticus]
MASNYWASSQAQYWTFTKQELEDIRHDLGSESPSLVGKWPLPELRHLSIYFHQQISKLAKRTSASQPIRQQALATAQVYVRRFYTKVEIRKTNPYLVMATAFYLACKMEESPQHIRLVVSEAHHQWPDLVMADISKLGECEFWLISEMNSQLILHHPYRSLSELQQTFALTTDEALLASSIINDHYLTDLPFLHAPHVMAITAIILAVTLRPNQANLQAHAAATSAVAVQNAMQALGRPQLVNSKVTKLIDWLAESSIDMAAVAECTQEMISLYEIWESYVEKDCKDRINRFVKVLGLDK